MSNSDSEFIMRPSSSHLYTGEASRFADEQTIRTFGIDGFSLMEVAATRGADFILEHFPNQKKILAIAGKGNNAGDALAICRILASHGYTSDIYFALGSDRLSEDCEKNRALISKLQSISPEVAPTIVSEVIPSSYQLILDGLFGTGLHDDIENELAKLIERINSSGLPVISMDIPSGLHSGSGQIMGISVTATVTLMFGTRKLGCYIGSGPEVSGKRFLCELPFPEAYLEQDYPVKLLDDSITFEIPDKPKPRHKYEAGVVYVIGGSPGLTGAAILAARAAWSTGCGAVTVCCPRGISQAYDAHLVEQTRLLCGSSNDLEFKAEHASELLSAIQLRKGVILLGPGIGRSNDTISFVRELLKSYSGTLVLDADALHALSIIGTDMIHPETNVILTPHAGELKKLHNLEQPTPDTLKKIIETYPNPEQTRILAKGYPCLSAGNKKCYITEYDTRIFGRTGFGDVLAGKISGYLSMRNDPDYAICTALLKGWEKASTIKSESELSPLNVL